MSDLRQRVPGHSLIDMLLHQWDIGTIRLDAATNGVVVDDEAVSWYRGVIGERRVGTILDSLDTSHTVLHSVPVGKGSSDIDHVVIGRAGVFTINTKYSPGKKIWVNGYGLFVDGHKQFYVRNSTAEARRAADLLSEASGLTVPVTALIVFVDPGAITHKGSAGGGEHDPAVRVLADAELFRVFTSRPEFSDEQVGRIVAAAVRPETWHQSPAESTVGHHITREFEALEEEVGPHLARAFAAPAKVSAPRMPAPSARNRVGSSAPRRTRTPTPSRSRGRKRQSSTEKFFSGLIFPAAGLLGLWLYTNSITGK
jgi:Nuclease-related domain